MAQSTISVDSINNPHALRMVWHQDVQKSDVTWAFQQIETRLRNTDQPLYVIVDITAKPNFPLAATINAAMFGPYRNPQLKEWLIVGTNTMAKSIERVLAGSMGRKNVRWFETEDAALAYLEIATQNDTPVT